MSEELTTQEAIRLEQCEATIQEGLQTFVDVGRALLAIREERLYRETYRTFEDYCERKWAMDDRYARRLIAAATVVADLAESGPTGPVFHAPFTDAPAIRDVVLPSSERQARPLASLESPEERREAWSEAVATAPEGKVTAKHVEKVVKEKKAAKEAAPTVEPPAIKAVPDSKREIAALREKAVFLLKVARDLGEEASALIERLPKSDAHEAANVIWDAIQGVSNALNGPAADLQRASGKR